MCLTCVYTALRQNNLRLTDTSSPRLTDRLTPADALGWTTSDASATIKAAYTNFTVSYFTSNRLCDASKLVLGLHVTIIQCKQSKITL